MLTEVLLKMGQFRECLRMLSNSLLVMLRHMAEVVQVDRISVEGSGSVSRGSG